MFNKILIANRGEIAVRIIRSCREMGIKTAVICSDVDSDSLHARMADEVIKTPSMRGYLDMDWIVETAKNIKAEAIHPGYGFLSENYLFAAKCEEENIVFIGPEAKTIKLMGDKVQAKKCMAAAGVPVTIGSGVITDVNEAQNFAESIGYPVMVKASAGGGGRGMRLAYSQEELLNAFETAKSEAELAFGNKDLYIEKYLEECRHVEMQILADTYGQVIYLAERDCSVQRRNQKLIEESPSPAVNSDLRKLMGEAAVSAASAVNYRGAGTIEYLLDKDNNFYFMEMNTRIQVEHPVTELVCDIDLVKEQIWIAAGERLEYSQSAIEVKGWSMECRINAEDPETFFPYPGKVTYYQPPGGPGVRLDSAIYPGFTISSYYDSLIAKLVIKGKDRSEVISRMQRALAEFEIKGVKTTIPFHQRVLSHPDFREGKITTSFVADKITPKHAIGKTNSNDNQENRVSDEIDNETAAVIAAAIEMYSRLEKENYRIINIKAASKSCSPWRMAGLMERMGR